MKYKLYNPENHIKDVVGHILFNRGIEKWKEYLTLDDSVIEPYTNLDNIKEAVECCKKHIEQKSNIGILADEDSDGYSSAAMMYMYLKKTNDTIPITYIMHTRTKAHGLDFNDDITIPINIQLLIIPDAGTNDVDECEILKQKGIDIIILDHHQSEHDNPNAIIVNNQLSPNYSNKNLCGAGIVYRFLQALDDELWQEYADDYLDLVALANIADAMDIRSFETRRLITKGLANIQNKCFKAFIAAQSYSMKDIINVHNIQWFIVPVLNGVIRVGSLEEKELLFKAFIEQDETFEYKTRASKDKPSEIIQEDIYTRAARISKNAKARQDKSKEKAIESIIDIADAYPKENKVILLDVTDILDTGMTGVVAIKISEMYNKPCILVKKRYNNKYNKYVFFGSARNLNNSPIDSFKNVVNTNEAFNFGNGHNSAFGVELDDGKLNDAINNFNKLLANVEYDATYKVDFILDEPELDFGFVNDLTTLPDVIGQGVEEPRIALENVHIRRGDISVVGKNEDVISFMLNGIKFIQFRCHEGNPLFDWVNNTWNEDATAVVNIVGTPTINDFEGLRTLQVNILGNEITGEVEQIQTSNEDDEW